MPQCHALYLQHQSLLGTASAGSWEWPRASSYSGWEALLSTCICNPLLSLLADVGRCPCSRIVSGSLTCGGLGPEPNSRIRKRNTVWFGATPEPPKIARTRFQGRDCSSWSLIPACELWDCPQVLVLVGTNCRNNFTGRETSHWHGPVPALSSFCIHLGCSELPLFPDNGEGRKG